MERDKAKVIGVSELKAKCTGIVQKVRRSRMRYVVTVRGEPAVEIRPLATDAPRQGRLGTLIGTAKLVGDIVSSEGHEFEYDTDPQRLLS